MKSIFHHFFIHIFHHLSLKQIRNFYLEGESPTLSHQTWTIYIGKDNTFQESFEQFERLALSSESFFNLTACYNYATTNYIEIPVIHLFEMVNKENFKMVNVSC